jgi:glycosyltransferase involved in cell wall biosynthesis
MAAEKNLGLAVEAFLRLQELAPRARFVLVGDGPEQEALRARYPHFQYAGSRRGEELAAHYASADLFIFPSTTETFGNVVTEALASGLVVLSYDYAAARQYIRHGINGYVARFNEPAELLRQTAEVVADMPRWPLIRQAARETAVAITWDSIIDTFETALLDAGGVFEPAPAV